MPASELAKRFSLEKVGLSAGVFDEEKLAWANRHYLKMASQARIAELSVPYFRDAGVEMTPTADGLEFLASVMPIASGSVDRLDQVPGRLGFLFTFDPRAALAEPSMREEMSKEGPRAIVHALAETLAAAPRLTREQFRQVANQVKTKTGEKGRSLFHPIRVALTGRAAGPELDLAVPAIDRGAELPDKSGLPKILGCRERAAEFLRCLGA
jgi:glutamyl/glutaminyl-tRNA synthetase